MERVNFTQYDVMPPSMTNYLRYYGPHFNRKLCLFAVEQMYKEHDGKKISIKPYTREQVNNMLAEHGITLKKSQLCDAVYVANMCKADFLGSSIEDEEHVARYIKDVIDDPDAYDGIVFNRWYADMAYTGTAIDWESML